MSDSKLSKHCLKLYRDLRRLLTTEKKMKLGMNNRALEIKHEEKNSIVSWRVGFSHKGIQALTGKVGTFKKNSLVSGVVGDPTKNKKVEFVESGLRTPSDIYKGQICMVYRDKTYSL